MTKQDDPSWFYLQLTDSKFSPEWNEQSFRLAEFEEFLQKLVLCPSCESAFFECDGTFGGSCWSCKSEIETVDDSHGMGVYAVLGKIKGEPDENAIYIVGDDGSGWAFAEWCEMVGKDFDIAEHFWNC